MILHPDFLTCPIAHRALHDLSAGRPENSRAAVEAAIAGGFGIEIDLQLSADGKAMVFHDYALERLTGEVGAIRQRNAAELAKIQLTGGSGGIPSFPEILDIVSGQVPLLVEIKDQDGALGPNVGILEREVVAASQGYEGPIAFMSFNPHSMIALGALAPDVPRGLTTCGFDARRWPTVPQSTRERLAGIPDLVAAGACFISHDARDLDSPRVAELKAGSLPVLCWTIRSADAEIEARKIADNVTFEGYAPT
ncbi:glycerophosphodiester phosphodiesterase family protein [Tropicimonas sp. TH_r6]|uniref:glycerophosphodiester phosphodiesterase family protein n=1 Tax=Tropicimonas sp. TH_r6 TaxID=3082085 RepID=UPI002953F63C|nr:glycerophosphodiester phosphodiesterase family protein [Tropicimonas sp. TH_r6]MDV7144121.1 glycerophosphodiester phosphodiesterase family protein [Tropicimonas sp. TH_r6]